MKQFAHLGRFRSIIKNYATTTVDTSEIQHFKQFASDWWNVNGRMKPLHSMNKLRVPLIRDGLANLGSICQDRINTPCPLKDLSILDVGCGGGILAEPLSRLGGNVTGLDANAELIALAKAHAQFENLNINFEESSIEEYAEKNTEKYDAVVTSETLEHVTQKEEFLRACLQCLKPNGSLFITTMNKTLATNFIGIFLVENVFHFLPEGTHDFDKMIEPHKLQRMLIEQNCKTVLVHGMVYVPFSNNWYWCDNKFINYALHAVKMPSDCSN